MLEDGRPLLKIKFVFLRFLGREKHARGKEGAAPTPNNNNNNSKGDKTPFWVRTAARSGARTERGSRRRRLALPRGGGGVSRLPSPPAFIGFKVKFGRQKRVSGHLRGPVDVRCGTVLEASISTVQCHTAHWMFFPQLVLDSALSCRTCVSLSA
ncbi:hypothetical protein AGIG_G18174 [Arapaima gigas]